MKIRNLTDTWQQIVITNNNLFPGWRGTPLIYWTNALAGEVGELCNDAKHMTGGGTHRVKVTKKKMVKEMSDCFIYLILLAESEGISADAFAKAVSSKNRLNIRRMKKRKG